jgi:outer membrane protein
MRGVRMFAAAAASVLALASAPAVSAETLADALIAAYKNSNLLEQNRALLRATDEDVAVAVAALRPVIAFTADAEYAVANSSSLFGGRSRSESLSSSVGLTAQMTIFDFGRNALALEAAKETVLATREALVALEQDVLLLAVSAYVDVRLAQDIVALRQNNVRLIEQELRAARDRFEVGEVTRTDVAIAEAALAAARAGLTSAQGDLTIARESYKAATGAYPGALSAPPAAPATARSLDEARAIALRTHPDIRQAQRNVTVAELNVARGKAAMRPSLTGRAGLALNDDGTDRTSLSLSLGQTIYAGGEISAVYRQALASRDAQRASLQQAGVSVAQGVGNAWSNVDVARASIAANDEQVRASQTAYEGVREEATLGARTTLDVLDAEQDLLDARFARASAQATLYVGTYQVLSSMGLLTVDHLKLGIPTYDAAAYYNAVKNAPATSAQGKKLDRVLQAIGGN